MFDLKYIFRKLSGPLIVFWLLSVCLVFGCTRGFDPRLSTIDSKIEENPDSAKMLLNGYSLTPQASAADSAYYALLLTHARYKNFIDETDDSLISTATEYFLNHGDDEKASRALFLKGIILMNANHLGEAAVSFRQGLDIAHEGKHYMWEGQCARGLFIIYAKIKNYSEQIKYAQAEYDAFVKGNYPNWANNAKLNILRAYQNNQQFDKVEDDAFVLLTTAEEVKDTMLMEEVLVLIGSCKYALGNYKDALDSYLKAYSLDPSIIRTTHGYNIAVAAANIEKDSLTNGMKSFISSVTLRKETLPAFKVLASQGRFEEAFNGLERYKDYQDSILQIICRNNVAESIGHYDNTRTVVHQKEIKIERILWGSGLLVLTIIIGVSYWIYKKNLYQKELERKHIEMSMEMLRTDLESQLAHMDEMTADILRINNKNEKMSCALRNLLYDRYKKINDLCDSYYQDRIVGSKKKKLEKEMGNLLKDFSDLNFLNEIGRYIDLCLEDLYTSFITDFPNLNEDSQRLFMFLTLGLSNRTICVILNLENANLYNRKSRLKKFIAGSNATRKEDYLKNIR